MNRYAKAWDKMIAGLLGIDARDWARNQLWALDCMTFGKDAADWFEAVRA